ncbi:hypothetical protein [Urechidicola croceus]|uniref:Uncharacterized protein n=1 Tax=Urechidicola croceus TaxID=1850246 RepID=A0A1D8P807_9FLAO|nr:hypothetical protein [Urechidicola croceus]AOW20700.1 hypothetical protein LPB138_08435 [Urechidicola croceus]
MNIHVDKTQNKKSELASNLISPKKNITNSTFHFANKHSDAVFQRKLIEIVNKNPAISQFSTINEITNSSPEINKKPQVKNTSNSVVQRIFNVSFSKVQGNGPYQISEVKYQRNSSETTGGPHVTPNSLFVMQVEKTILNKPFDEAFNNLKGLFQKFMVDENEVDIPLRNKIYASFKIIWDKYKAIDPADIDAMERTQVIQQLSEAYIKMRNSRKGAIVTKFSGRKEEGEEKEEISKIKAVKNLDDLRNRRTDDVSIGDGIEKEQKRSKRETNTPLIKLAEAIFEWCDTATLKSAHNNDLSNFNNKNIKLNWAQRHLNDAIYALGITDDEKVYINSKEENLKTLLTEKYLEKMKAIT